MLNLLRAAKNRRGWLYEGGALFGPWAQPRFVTMTGRSVIGADWTDIVRPSADFSDSAIANTDLRGADLSNGNSTNSNLLGSFITGTDFTGA